MKKLAMALVLIAGLVSAILMFMTASDLYDSAKNLSGIVGGSVPFSAYAPYVAHGLMSVAVSLGLCVIIGNIGKAASLPEAKPMEQGRRAPAPAIETEKDDVPAGPQKINVKDIDPETKIAIEIIFKEGRVSEPLLREKLAVGQSELSGILKRVEELGIIAQPEGLSIYKVIMTEEQHKARLTVWG